VRSNLKLNIHNSKLQKLARLLLDWFSQNARDLPWRRTRDPYAIWVSEIMLQQTQVKTVIPYWERWMRELPTIGAAANASPAKIHKLWEGLGYYTRVRNLQKAAQQILEKHDGKFPQAFEEVLALPGIGRYTAGAICSIAFNQPTPILDGNVIRVLTRVFGICENPREKKTNTQLWQLAEALVLHASRFTHHVSRASHLNQSLMELGALVCTPRQPQCEICPVKKRCAAFREDRVGELPNLGKREAATARHFVAFVVERNGRFLVRQRPAGVVNAHLWEFPNVEVAAGILPAVEPGVPPGGKNADDFKPVNNSRKISGGKKPSSTAGGTPAATMLAQAAKHLGLEPNHTKPLCTVKHSITRYRITLEAFSVQLGRRNSTTPEHSRAPSARPSEIGVWLTPARLRNLAFTAAHKTVLNQLQSPADDVSSTCVPRVFRASRPKPSANNDNSHLHNRQ
jgi:A/G-specific adenine glycosylase